MTAKFQTFVSEDNIIDEEGSALSFAILSKILTVEEKIFYVNTEYKILGILSVSHNNEHLTFSQLIPGKNGHLLSVTRVPR